MVSLKEMSDQEEEAYTLAMIRYHCQRICTSHREIWNILEQMNGQQCCWSCIHEDIVKNFQEKQNICLTCYGCVKDWLELPLLPTDIFFDLQKTKALHRISSWFAKELLHFIAKIGDLDERILQSRIYHNVQRLQTTMNTSALHDDLLWSTATLSACFESPFYSDIQYLIDKLTDAHVCIDIEDIPIFTAFWFWRIWNHMPIIHAEHMGFQPVSYAGPALGMTPLPNNPSETNVCPPLPLPLLFPLPSDQQQQQQSSWVLVEEEEEGELLEQGLSVVEDSGSENTA